MRNFPTLKTAIPFLQLQPLTKKHLPFLVELLSDKIIQQSLFRIPTKITPEKEAKALERMYEGDRPKEITYILTIKKPFSQKFIGYVKIKLIDWNVMSCYLSVALLPAKEYRGRGYAKAAYDSFFEYLFSLGFMKVYGRTYESNISTIRLNEATGFKFIGRQSNFILYPNKTSLDALLFEKLNPALETTFKKTYDETQRTLCDLLQPVTKALQEGSLKQNLASVTYKQIALVDLSKLPSPLLYFVQEVLEFLQQYEEHDFNKKEGREIEAAAALAAFRNLRAENASKAGFPLLSFPATLAQLEMEEQIFYKFKEGLNADSKDLDQKDTNALWYGGYTPSNWESLHYLFLGKSQKNDIMTILQAIKNANT